MFAGDGSKPQTVSSPGVRSKGTPTLPMSTSRSTSAGWRVASEGQRPAEAVADDLDAGQVQGLEEAERWSASPRGRRDGLGPLGVAEPGMSGATTRKRCARTGMVRRQLAHAATPGPDPWISSTGSPCPRRGSWWRRPGRRLSYRSLDSSSSLDGHLDIDFDRAESRPRTRFGSRSRLGETACADRTSAASCGS